MREDGRKERESTKYKKRSIALSGIVPNARERG